MKNINFMEEKSSSQSSEVMESEDTISFQTEIPKHIQQAMKAYIEKHPNWDQYRLLQAALAGFLIQNGEFKHPINEITIAGNFKDMFQNITLANDLEFEYSTNSPTMLIEGMVVAGK